MPRLSLGRWHRPSWLQSTDDRANLHRHANQDNKTMKVMQIGMNTSDMAGSLRIASEVLGFRNAGGQGLWGPPIRIQSLPDESRAIMWWLLGRSNTMQLELFHHTNPVQRALRPDWRPNDLGWVRYGVAVPDFAASLSALAANGVGLIAPPQLRDGLRRAAFREPYVGMIIEIIEEGDALPWRVQGDRSLPFLVYATSSVSDLAGAERYYRDGMGMQIEPLETLHLPDDEALWGLQGMERRGFVAHLGDMRLEVVEYLTDRGRSKPSDYRVSDQGIVNVGFRGESVAEVDAAFARLAGMGHVPAHTGNSEGIRSGYITDYEREIEIIAVPDEIAAIIGFTPAAPFLC
jgi:catechol 2,3-dioxygenase-like lactoylglutathione lyase family enzyme